MANIKRTTEFNFKVYEEVVEPLVLNDVVLECDATKMLQPPQFKEMCDKSSNWFTSRKVCKPKVIVKAVYEDCFTKKAEFKEQQTKINLQLQRDYNERIAEAKNFANETRERDQQMKMM